MKIMQMNSMNIWGGGEVHVLLLCQGLLSLGVDVTLVCRSGRPMDQRARAANIPVLNLPLKGAIDVRSAWKLADYCQANAIDIIHAHNGRDYWLASAAKFLNPRLKVIITRHILSPLKDDLVHRCLHKKIDKVIAVSEAVKNTLTVLPPEKISVIYNGIDTDKFANAQPGKLRQELGIAATTKIIGMVGRVHPEKGHKIFIQSIPAIQSAAPDTVFVIVGGGDYISELKAINRDVHFLGPRSNIPEIMKDLDIFVLASLNEPFGLVVLEAMAAGAPVVATNAGGAAEIIADGETALAIPPGAPDKLAQAVIRILTDSQLADRLIANGRNRAKQFDIRDMVISTRNIYADVLSEN